MARLRLDLVLVERGIVDSRTKAQSLIMARRVKVNGQFADKAGAQVLADDLVEITELEHPFVGRGGMKLAHAFKHFSLSVENKVCLDIGASTGGFTDVMLKQGARKVFAVDVGYGQLDQSLREDPRVVVREKTNARYLEPEDFDEPVDFISIDVSFISLELILPPARKILRPGGELVALIKPQFEVGKKDIGKGGIVRDTEKRDQVVERIRSFAASQGFAVAGVTDSPIKGMEGNVEFLMWCQLA